jgi:hypothetical protein
MGNYGNYPEVYHDLNDARRSGRHVSHYASAAAPRQTLRLYVVAVSTVTELPP